MLINCKKETELAPVLTLEKSLPFVLRWRGTLVTDSLQKWGVKVLAGKLRAQGKPNFWTGK